MFYQLFVDTPHSLTITHGLCVKTATVLLSRNHFLFTSCQHVYSDTFIDHTEVCKADLNVRGNSGNLFLYTVPKLDL